jgi:hypothetical protein
MPDSGHAMLTVLLHHDQSRPRRIMAHLKTGFYRDFPPRLGVRVLGRGDVFGFVINLKSRPTRSGASTATWSRGVGAFRYQVFRRTTLPPCRGVEEAARLSGRMGGVTHTPAHRACPDAHPHHEARARVAPAGRRLYLKRDD